MTWRRMTMSGMTSDRPEELYRIAACVYACEGIPTEALEAGVIRDLINAATRYLQITTRDTDDDPNCWFEEEFTKAWLSEVLDKVRGEA